MLIPFGIFSAGANVPQTYELISSNILGTTAATVTFSSIPAGYKHLQLRATTRSNGAYTVGTSFVSFNNDLSASYSFHSLYTGGSGFGFFNSLNTGSVNFNTHLGASASSNIFGTSIMDILDFASTSKYKTVRTIGGSTSEFSFAGGMWMNTAAITSVTIGPQSGSWIAGSRFSLYGIRG